MTNADLTLILPFIVIAATSLILMLMISFYRCHILAAFLTLAGITLSFFSLTLSYPLLPRQVTSLLILDHYAVFYSGLILAASFLITALSYGYLQKQGGDREEFYVLLLLAIFGSTVLVASNHFASLFLGLEILSVSLYALIAYLRTNERGFEAGIKYLVLAATSAAVLLFGMALIYGELGTMSLSDIASRMASPGSPNIFLLAGTAMIIVGLGFKLAVVPFHMWTPDVYEGSPAPVTAFIASVSKGALLALLLRYFTLIDIRAHGPLFLIFTLIAIASMFAGNLLALLQNNVKRILAYSSICTPRLFTRRLPRDQCVCGKNRGLLPDNIFRNHHRRFRHYCGLIRQAEGTGQDRRLHRDGFSQAPAERRLHCCAALPCRNSRDCGLYR